jgi:hypothetical protein
MARFINVSVDKPDALIKSDNAILTCPNASRASQKASAAALRRGFEVFLAIFFICILHRSTVRYANDIYSTRCGRTRSVSARGDGNKWYTEISVPFIAIDQLLRAFAIKKTNIPASKRCL